MRKNLLQEVKAMNKVAGTQMTKEQEINFIRERLNELEFDSQKELDAYKKSHKVRKGTKLTVLNLKVLAVKQRSSGKQIETDKALMTYEAESEGIINILVPAGENVAIGVLIATITEKS